MAKLQAFLFALTVLATISRCEEVARTYPDSVAVKAPPPSSSFSLSSWAKSTVNVRFNEIRVKGPDSDVLYRRTTVRDLHLQFATNETFMLPPYNFVECARAAGSKGLDAFMYNNTCIGYRLIHKFHKCQSGDIVLYVLEDNFIDEATVVRFEDAPYTLLDIGAPQPHRLYMLSTVVEAQPSEHFKFSSDPIGPQFEWDLLGFNIIIPENGDKILALLYLIDLNFCLVDGAYGLPTLVAALWYNTSPPVVYFLTACGTTIQAPDFTALQGGPGMLVMSHEGLGCTYYPSDVSEECTVTFEGEDSVGINFVFPTIGAGEECSSFNMTLTKTSNQGNQTTTTVDTCSTKDPPGALYTTISISLDVHPKERTFGFTFAVINYDQ